MKELFTAHHRKDGLVNGVANGRGRRVHLLDYLKGEAKDRARCRRKIAGTKLINRNTFTVLLTFSIAR